MDHTNKIELVVLKSFTKKTNKSILSEPLFLLDGVKRSRPNILNKF